MEIVHNHDNDHLDWLFHQNIFPPIRGPRTSIWTGSGRFCAAVDKPKSRCKKRKIRRGKKSKSSANRQTACNAGLCNFLYAIINGFRSKSELTKSLKSSALKLLNETKVYSKSAINIRAFQAFPVVRSKKSGGGLYIGVKHGLCESIMIDDSENADLVTIRVSKKEHGIRIILTYGPQENDLEETVCSFYHDVSVQVEAAFLNGDSIILQGDFDAKLGFDVINHDMIPMSKNGEKLFNLFCKYNLTLLNTLDFL